jgi:hypothetical protein
MTEKSRALRSKHGGNLDAPHSTHPASPRSVSRSGLLMLLFAGLITGLPSQAQAVPPPNKVFFNCTFTTGAVGEGVVNLEDALNIPGLADLNGGTLEASYIIIYVRQNPNGGQLIGPPPATATSTYTGPILCTNTTDAISTTTATTPITDTVNILGAEEASHLRYRVNTSTNSEDNQIRVCHTVASTTDCFLIGSQPLE